jgi:copper(I)-binding protein
VELRDRSKGADAKAQAVEFIVVPAYGSLSMDEKGVYLMLTDLKRPLKAGEMVSVTLATQDSVKLPFTAAVRNR